MRIKFIIIGIDSLPPTLYRFICITFVGLTTWATIYENSLANTHEIGDENVSPSRQAIHPLHIAKAIKTMNGQRIYSYENATIDLETTEPAIKLDKLHTNNIINGCTFELHPISIEHTNGNHLANNNRSTMTTTTTPPPPPTTDATATDGHGGFYRLNNNNNINNNHHANHNDDLNDNNHLKPHGRNGQSVYRRNALNAHTSNHLSE